MKIGDTIQVEFLEEVVLLITKLGVDQFSVVMEA